MLATPHMIAGVAMVKVTRKPWLLFPIVFLSHFLLDFVPHTCIAFDDIRLWYAMALCLGVDAVIGAGLLYWLLRKQLRWKLMLAAAFTAILADILEFISARIHPLHELPPFTWLTSLHGIVGWHVMPPYWIEGFVPQFIFLIIGACTIYFLKERKVR